MPVTISYDENQKLTFHGLECDCPLHHEVPNQDVYVGTGLVEKIPQYIEKRGFGTNCVLVTDNILYPLYAKNVENILRAAGFDVTLCVITREDKVEPDERTCGEILLSITQHTQFLISVGSGSLTDSTRVNAVRCKLPFVAVGTAPSMDGYTSAISPLLLRGVKIHRDAICPDIIVCDLDILKTAPLSMVASGVGDVLGKYIADVDYRLGHIIKDEPYCHTCGQMCVDATNKVLENIEEIKKRSTEGIRALTEGLLVTGLTILIIGITRCVASMEHNCAHYWEMMQLLRGEAPPPHGTSVGVGTLLVLPFFKKFMEEDVSKLDEDKIIAGRLTNDEIEKQVFIAYGEEAGNAVMTENTEIFLPEDVQRQRIRRVKERFPAICETFAALPDYETIYNALAYLEAPLTCDDLGVPDDMRALSLRWGSEYRVRYTLFKTLRECGLLDEYLEEFE